MDTEEFRKQAKKTVDYICNYRESSTSRRVYPGDDVKVDFLKHLIAGEAPMFGEDFDQILDDIDKKLMPGLVHWNHPSFFAYFPSGSSYPSILGDLLSSAINQIGFSWRASPALVEHEKIVMNMYAKALDLPKIFMYDEQNNSKGGGAMQNSASDCIMIALIAARARAIGILKGRNAMHDSLFLPFLVAYTSQEAHSCVQKAAKIAIIKLRVLPTDENGCMRTDELARTIKHDVEVEGFTPCFVSATVGTTGTCAFDNLTEIGRICKQYSTIWFHVDGAYGGNSFLLPEMRAFKNGLEYADSFNTNPNKFALTTFDCSCLWVKNLNDLKNAMVVDATYLKQDINPERDGEELRNYGIPLSRRFRSLKLWCVLRTYGIQGLQNYMRNHIRLAKRLESYILADKRFSLENVVHLGLVCFKLKVDDRKLTDLVNAEFLERMNESGKIHMIPTTFHGNFIIRMCITNEHANEEEITKHWRIIQDFASEILDDYAKQRLECQKKQISPRSFQAKAKTARFSFTRSVSRDVYDQQQLKVSLRDGGTPILIVDPDDLSEHFERATHKNHYGNDYDNRQ